MKLITYFRLVARIEGWSFILLLSIAMPLKYIFDMPLAVKYVGWAHGVLFVAYIYLLLRCWIELNWSFKTAFWGFIASVIPFGTFVFERRWLNQPAKV